MFISEVLCFMINKFSCTSRLQLKSILTAFFKEDELSDAKDQLFNDAAKMNVDGLPRNVKRARGDNRLKALADDLLDVFTCLDEKQALTSLPVYVARNLDRIPAVKLEDMELFCVSQKLEALEKRLAAVETVNSKLDHISDQLAVQMDTVTGAAERIDMMAAVSEATQRPAMWADTADTASASNQSLLQSVPETINEGAASVSVPIVGDSGPPFQLVERRKSQHRHQQQQANRRVNQVRLRGTKSVSDDRVRAVPRTGVLSAFVGRLHKDTTAEALTAYLSAEGMRGIVCRRLSSKNGRVWDTAAFQVTCCRDSESLFYDEQRWPEGVELRDWYFK